ncbi:MAG: Holliday junction branch migration protein RuvA [Pseudomonadota bacterium]
MIGRLSGGLIYRAADHALIDVGGVGYVVYCSERTLAGLPPPGGAATLWTDLMVREDLLQLYGFETLVEKEWYRLLLTVQGVGAKAALAILGTLGAEGVSRAIALGDAASVKAAPGVGPKIAQRVVNELKDKAAGVMAMGGAPLVVAEPAELAAARPQGTSARDAPAAPAAATPVAPAASGQADALSALANLGYAPAEAAAAVAAVSQEMPEADAGTLIRAALKRLAPTG